MAFKTGFDPNRNITKGGTGRPPEYEIKQITGPARQRLIEKLCEILTTPIDEVENVIKNMSAKLSVGDTIVFNTLMNVARKEPTIANVKELLKILGHKFEEPAQFNINMSLESLVADAHIESSERVIEAPNGAKVIVRKKAHGVEEEVSETE